MNIRIRSESNTDAAAIEALTIAAFLSVPHASHTEQFIVRALRKAEQLSVSLVAELSSDIVGHVAVSPVTISSGARDWYGLGPISVAPECQNRGVGSQLMEQALVELRKLDAAGCVLLGEPQYYARFGFRAEPDLVLPDVPPEYFLAISFTSGIPVGTVSYHKAFNAQH